MAKHPTDIKFHCYTLGEAKFVPTRVKQRRHLDSLPPFRFIHAKEKKLALNNSIIVCREKAEPSIFLTETCSSHTYKVKPIKIKAAESRRGVR